MEAGPQFQFEVEVTAGGWVFCFSDLQVKPQYLSLVFGVLFFFFPNRATEVRKGIGPR